MVEIIKLHGDPHRQTQMLLPWYVNGSLDAAETAEVQAHLDGCADCRAELEIERVLGREVAALDSGVEGGWAALKARAGRPRPSWRSVAAALGRPIPVGWAIAAQAAGVAAVVALLRLMAPQPHSQPAAYHVLGDAAAAPVGNLIVVFDPAASERDLRAVLSASGARIVDGPTASDAYVLRVPTDRRQAALAALRADRRVNLAQPLDSDLK